MTRIHIEWGPELRPGHYEPKQTRVFIIEDELEIDISNFTTAIKVSADPGCPEYVQLTMITGEVNRTDEPTAQSADVKDATQ